MSEGAFKSTKFSDLDSKSLQAICGQLDGHSLAIFSALNQETRRAAEAEGPWSREFPHYFSELQQERSFGARPSWRAAYAARQRAEKNWSDASTLEPIRMLENPGRSLLSIEFLQDPFPTNVALSGALIESTQAGEFMVYNLDAIRSNSTRQLENADSANVISSVMEVVPLKSRPGRSSSLSAGIFHIAQRPETNQLAVTTLSTEAHILRLLQKKESKPVNDGANSVDDVDMMDVDSTSWELDVEYNLTGHTGGCAAVRCSRSNNKAVTACFDGCLRVFDLPPISNNSDNTEDGDGGDTATTTTTAGPTTATAHGFCNTSSTIYQPEALCPIATFMDDPEHTQQPPLNEQNRGVCGLALSSSADRMVSGSNDMQIKVWDTATGRITLRLGGCMGWPWWVEGLDPEFHTVTSASTDGYVREWDLRVGTQSLALNLHSDSNNSIFPVATVLPRVDGNYLVAGCFDKAIYVVDRRMGRVVKDLKGHNERLARLALRGDTLLSCAFDGDVGLWDF